jgi:hypothetical protein
MKTLVLAALGAVAAFPQLPFGPDTCRSGFVWRDAFPGDHVCVTTQTRAQAAQDNALADSRRQPGGGASGPDTCKPGFVWRDARPGDHVCVPPLTRGRTASDNRQAANRFARNPENPALEEKFFAEPRYFDQRLDNCLTWGANCGQPPADHFCRNRFHTRARAFETVRVSPTKLIGTGQDCSGPNCVGYLYIACDGHIGGERVFANPAWQDRRLDNCLQWGQNCGKPPADRFCQAKGFSSAFHWVVDHEPSRAPTIVMGTGQICNTGGCRGYGMIICQ